MTSVADGLTHTISAHEFDLGVRRGTGRYRAECGVEVIADALASEPGPTCGGCLERRATGARIDSPERGRARLLWLLVSVIDRGRASGSRSWTRPPSRMV